MKNDPSVKESEELIKEGFQLIKIRYHDDGKLITTLEYIKGDEKKVLEVKSCSEEFLDYVNSFWGHAKIPINSLKNAKIEISGFIFTNFKITNFEQGYRKRQIYTKFSFEIDLITSDENKDFLNIDYRDLIYLYIDDELKFSGYITIAKYLIPSYESFSVLCEDRSCKFDTEIINAEITIKKGINSGDFIGFICRLSDVDIKPNSIINFHSEKREFELIIPVQGLSITNELQLGKCLISSKTPEIPIIKKSSSFNRFNNFAHLKIGRENYYEALMDGLKVIHTVVNFLSFRIKIPTFFESYDFRDQRSLVKLADIIYLKDSKHESELIIHLPWLKPRGFERVMLTDYYFRPIKGISEYFVDPDHNLTAEEEKGLWIFYYLNSAEVNLDRKVAFLNLWIAFEFMISRFSPKVTKEFKRSEIKDIRTFCNNYYNIRTSELTELLKKKEISEDLLNKKKERYEIIQRRIIQLINEKFNEISINKRLKTLLQDCNINLSPKEWKIYTEARNKRNGIIHGRESYQVSNEEYNIISKIIYFVLKKKMFEKIIIDEWDDIRFENPMIPLVFRTAIDYLIEGLEKLYPSNTSFTKLKLKINELSKQGMPLPKELEEFSQVDLKIPKEFDLILEKLSEVLIKIYQEDENIISANKLIRKSHFIEDLHMVFKTFLDYILKGLNKHHPQNVSFVKVQFQLDQLSKLGIVSLRVFEAMKGIEKWKRRQIHEKKEELERIKCPKCNSKIFWRFISDPYIFEGICSKCGFGLKYLNGTVISDIKIKKN